MKTIKVRQDKKTGECYLKLSDFKNLVDISKVKKYSLEPVDDCGDDTKNIPESKALILKFYDENNEVIEAKS